MTVVTVKFASCLSSICPQRTVYIERDKAEQLVIFHFGERDFVSVGEQLRSKGLFLLQEAVDTLLDSPAANELVHKDVFFCPIR